MKLIPLERKKEEGKREGEGEGREGEKEGKGEGEEGREQQTTFIDYFPSSGIQRLKGH